MIVKLFVCLYYKGHIREPAAWHTGDAHIQDFEKP